jgi:hypothetical protein
MIASDARRTLSLNKAALEKAVQIRLISSMNPTGPVKKDESKKERREIHHSANVKADAATPTTALMDRFTVTAEVTIPKIFPAGFCWQSSSMSAGDLGYASDSLNFALTTGLGDGLGVLGGPYAYCTVKKAITGSTDINLTKELHTDSAAFCSGAAWQTLVNAFQGANLPFPQVFAGTWLGCGVAILSGPFRHVEEPTYENGKADVSLSTAIGGATGFFVGTYAAYLPDQNVLINIVDIQDGFSDLTGAAITGASTSLGFLSAQSGMNMIFPAGKCWNDYIVVSVLLFPQAYIHFCLFPKVYFYLSKRGSPLPYIYAFCFSFFNLILLT